MGMKLSPDERKCLAEEKAGVAGDPAGELEERRDWVRGQREGMEQSEAGQQFMPPRTHPCMWPLGCPENGERLEGSIFGIDEYLCRKHAEMAQMGEAALLKVMVKQGKKPGVARSLQGNPVKLTVEERKAWLEGDKKGKEAGVGKVEGDTPKLTEADIEKAERESSAAFHEQRAKEHDAGDATAPEPEVGTVEEDAGWYHLKDGWNFRRTTDGSVQLRQMQFTKIVAEIEVTAEQWVAMVVAVGSTDFQEALLAERLVKLLHERR